MSNIEKREAIHSVTQVLSTQVASDTREQVIPNSRTTASGIRYFTRMNPPTLFGSKVKKYLKWFIDEVFKLIEAMGVSSKKRQN